MSRTIMYCRKGKWTVKSKLFIYKNLSFNEAYAYLMLEKDKYK